jgi:N-methylhydantoinase B
MSLSTKQSEATTTVDAFTTEVIRSAVVSITSEMKTNLMRTAYNSIIYEAEDFTVGLFDENGDTVSIGLGLPMFVRGLSDTVKAKLAYWGRDGMKPGDILLTNDPAIMGSHLNHLIFTLPVFHDDELMAFVSSMAHWQDIGGQLTGVTRDLYTEGLQIPFVKIFKEGKQDPELTALIRSNVRIPDSMMGDMRAQIAAIRTGERRTHALLERYGNGTWRESLRQIYDQSEKSARQAVSEIPDGVYEAESFMDDDGVSLDKRIPIRIRVEVAGDNMTMDLGGCSPQVAGYFNSGPTAGRSAAEVAFKFLTSPKLLPINEGSFRPLTIVLPPGRIVSATKPAAVRMWMTVPMTVVDTVFRALTPACPERVIAGHHADLALVAMFGVDPATGRSTILRHGAVIGGGWGAVWNHDGQSATVCLNDGDTHNRPVESAEAKVPFVITRRELRVDSAGPGKFRGGLGVAQEVRMLIPGRLETKVERTQCAPWGLLGGKDAFANAVAVVHENGRVERFKTGKVQLKEIPIEGGYIIETGGGGGFGPPQERDPQRVLDDVRSGYVTPAAAAADYDVVVRGEGIDAELDIRETDERRGQLTKGTGQ